jgi:hypothetical protein
VAVIEEAVLDRFAENPLFRIIDLHWHFAPSFGRGNLPRRFRQLFSHDALEFDIAWPRNMIASIVQTVGLGKLLGWAAIRAASRA